MSAMVASVKPSRWSTHHVAGLLPDREQHALALVVAGAVLVRLAEVAERDRTVDGRQDLGQPDLARAAGPARSRRRRRAWSAPARRPSAPAGSARGTAGGGRCARRCRAPTSGPPSSGVQRERQQRPAGVVAPGRHAHGPNGTGLRPTPNPDVRRPFVLCLGVASRWWTSDRCRPTPIVPDYAGANVRGIIPALLGPATWDARCPTGCRPSSPTREQVVLLVLDGLGWEQLQEHAALVPTLSSMEGGRDHHRRARRPRPPR